MKLAYMMATPELKSMPMAWVGDYERILPRLAEIGYDGVELQVRDPAEFDQQALARCAEQAGLRIAAVSTGAVGAEDNLYLMSPDPEIRRRAVERYTSVLQLAGSYGVDASIGRFRGQVKWGPDRQTAIGWFRAALDELVPVAERVGVRIVLEPQMRFIGDFLNTIDETLAFIQDYGSPTLMYEGDLFHQDMEERSLLASIVAGQRSGRMSFFQLCDSNRLAPGWGHHNWVDIIEVLRASGYDGWLSMEFNQQPDSHTCARQAFSVVGPLVRLGR
ncbi:MAG: sugar phosphate isomerase/epimerase [Chloroflexota bacterium]|nr:sugar phosphate isomerase/epimerase [Chloroflexota bacterium]